MEEKKKKKLTFGRRVKRGFKRFIRKIVKFFINVKDRFMSLPQKLRYIIGVWILVLLIIIVLIVGSNKTSKSLDTYHELENTLTEASLNYVINQDLYPSVGKKLRVDMEMLVDEKYLSESYIPDKTCIGYSIVYYEEEESDYNVESYVNCKHYTTKNFAQDFEQ